MIRPEELSLCVRTDPNTIPVTVELVEPLGCDNLLYFDPSSTVDGGREYKTFVDPEVDSDVGETIYVTFDEQDVHLFGRETGGNLRNETRVTTDAPPP